MPELAWNSAAISIGFCYHPIILETWVLPGKQGNPGPAVVPAAILTVQPFSSALESSVSLPSRRSRSMGTFIRKNMPNLGCDSHPDEAGHRWDGHTPRHAVTWATNIRVILLTFNNCLLPVISGYFSFLLDFCLHVLLRFSMVSIILSIALRYVSHRPLPASLPAPSRTWPWGLTASSLHSRVDATVSWMFSSLLIWFLLLLEHTLK